MIFVAVTITHTFQPATKAAAPAEQKTISAFHSAQNGMERTISVRFNRNIWDHIWRWSFLTSPTEPQCPFPFYIIIVSNMALLYPDNKYNNQMHSGLSRVECLQPEYTVLLGMWNFRNFKPTFLLNGNKCPRTSVKTTRMNHPQLLIDRGCYKTPATAELLKEGTPQFLLLKEAPQQVAKDSSFSRGNPTMSAVERYVAMGHLDCKTVHIFAYSRMREQSNKRSGTRLKTESKTGVLRACEARALRAHETSYATLYPFRYWFWEKNRLFCRLWGAKG